MDEPLSDTSGLDLTSLACGSRQHAFLPTGAPDHAWVYKLPSTSGVAEHYGMDLREYRPTGPLTTMLYGAFVKLPEERHRRRLAALVGRGAPDEQLRATDRRYRALCEARARSLSAAYRWTRRRHFRRMLTLVDGMDAEGLSELMLPFRIVRDATATVRAGGVVGRYRGPMLVQRRADFFDRSGRFDAFDWNDVVVTQHRLWRRGVALSDANEILGPKNWALVAGRLRLADFSSFTRSMRTARRLLADDVLDERQQRVLGRVTSEGPPDMAELARRYFEHVRAEINPSRFDQLWGCSSPAPARP